MKKLSIILLMAVMVIITSASHEALRSNQHPVKKVAKTVKPNAVYKVERFDFDDGIYLYNVTTKDTVYKMVDSDVMLNLMCPDCYDLSNND